MLTLIQLLIWKYLLDSDDDYIIFICICGIIDGIMLYIIMGVLIDKIF